MLAYILGTTKLGNKEIIQIETCFRDYKLGQEGLKNGGYLRDLKSRQRDFKSVQILQIGARENTNRVRDLKLGRGLKSVQNTVNELCTCLIIDEKDHIIFQY